jgi:type IV pilus assembly protein PilM
MLATDGSGPSNARVAEVLLPSSDDASEREPSPEAVGRAIEQCIGQLGLPGRGPRGITMGISGSDVIIKQISLPLLDDSEVGPALRFEARKHLPFDPQGMVIDFQILGRYLSEKRVDVLLAAVSQEHLDRHLAPLAALELSVDIVDATPLALTNALAQTMERDHDVLLLLDIGHASSHLTLYQKGEPYFSRRLEFGGRNLTRAIADRTHVPLSEAEEWKLAVGADQPGVRVDWGMPEMRAMHEAIERELLEELHRSFAFYRTLGSLPDALRMMISGGTARLPGLDLKLGELLGAPVGVFDPLGDADNEQVGPQFVQAYGLAMRTA